MRLGLHVSPFIRLKLVQQQLVPGEEEVSYTGLKSEPLTGNYPF